MIFKKAVIVGIGILGGSLAQAFKKYKICEEVTGLSRSNAHELAKNFGIIDRGFHLEDIDAGVYDADLVILCMPVKNIIEYIPIVSKIVKDGCIITDVGSTKRAIMNEAAKTPEDSVHFVGGHPMAGSEKTGFLAGSPDLFLKRPYAVTNQPGNAPEAFLLLIEMIRKIGALPIELDPETHDTIVAGISHLPQVLSTALMNYVGEKQDSSEGFFEMSGPAFREFTRVSGSSYIMWEDIFATNADNIKLMISGMIKELQTMKENLDKQEMNDLFDKANRFRKILTKDKG
ncbi:prephenate dehydrogenase [candidate division KSB1 bacterium]